MAPSVPDPEERPSPSRGEDARHALEDVLQDQAARARRREKAAPRPRADRGPLLLVASGVLLLASAVLWKAPPAWIQPPPPPPTPPALVGAEVRLTAYEAVLRLRAFRDSAGAYPETLAQVLPAPEDREGLTYQRLSGTAFRIVASREGLTVAYASTEPVESLLGDARRTLEEIRP